MRPVAHEADYSVPFTAVPNTFLDAWMRALSPNAFKVLLCVLRKTLGWQRTEAPISLSDLLEYTGIGSYQTLMAAIRELISLQVLEVDERRGLRGIKMYALTSRLLSTPTISGVVGGHQGMNPPEIVGIPLQKLKGTLRAMLLRVRRDRNGARRRRPFAIWNGNVRNCAGLRNRMGWAPGLCRLLQKERPRGCW